MNTIKLKQGCETELGIKLHQHFLGKISGVVGRDFEDLICDYFDGNYTQTNIQDRVESAFCDVRKDDTYISVKYSQAVKDKTLCQPQYQLQSKHQDHYLCLLLLW